MSNQVAARTQRRFMRYRCNQRLCVRYRVNGQEFIAYGRCNVVGRGGIGAQLPALELEMGQVVSLEIALSTPAAPIMLKAQVRNRQGMNYSFQFLEADARAAAQLQVLFKPEAVAAYTVAGG